ncbi:MAG: OsmC family protein [Promethearchaeota archaeon]
MVREENTIVKIKLKNGFIFSSELNHEQVKQLVIDETIEKEGRARGPDAAELLGLAILSCLSASFLFCLQKKNLTVDDLETTAEISFKKNEKGYVRVKAIDVKLIPKSTDPSVLRRIEQCKREVKSGHMFFEETCIITSSVREGIKVTVDMGS